MAKEYLNEKYSQPMTYKGVRFSIVDPSVYHVYFSPENNSEIEFEVIIQADLTIKNTREMNYETVPQRADNYYIQYFRNALMKELASYVENVFGENVDINVVTSKGSYGYLVPEELNDTLSVTEMEKIYDKYRIYILTDETFSGEEALRNLSENTFEFICVLKEKDYIPVEFGVQYFDGSGNKKQVTFGNISTINSEEQVKKILLSK